MNFSACLRCGRAAACRQPGCPMAGLSLTTPQMGLHTAMLTHLPADALMILPVDGPDPWMGMDDRDWRDSFAEPLDLRTF